MIIDLYPEQEALSTGDMAPQRTVPYYCTVQSTVDDARWTLEWVKESLLARSSVTTNQREIVE